MNPVFGVSKFGELVYGGTTRRDSTTANGTEKFFTRKPRKRGGDMKVDYESFRKEPREEFDITIDVASSVKSGAIITSLRANYPKATRISDGIDKTSECLGTVILPASGTTITQRVKGGVDGEQIKIEWLVNILNLDTTTEIIEAGLIMEATER